MKIGTDAILLGAWCNLKNQPNSVLDIGTGTGVIALMLAQRSDANTIDALEIEANAYEQAVENFEQSDWADRLFCYHASLQDFATEMSEENEKYDLLISNPPFYNESFTTTDQAKNKARFTTSLSFNELIENSVKLLSTNGTFTVIIPYLEETNFIAIANKSKLYLNRICHVKGTDNSKIKRSLLEFSFNKKEILTEKLTIETARHQYTEAYINLTKDFYLKM